MSGKARPAWLGMNTLAFLIVAVGFGASLLHVMRLQREAYPQDEVVVRLGHFQLESGFRDAMQEVIDDYNALQRERGHRVRVVQMAVNSRVYGQWLNTQMYSGSPPDIIQNRVASTTNNPSFVARFIAPLSGVAGEVNPYNAGTDLDGVPWKLTFSDNMRGAYNWLLQDQYGVSITIFTGRLFYNKSILREALGLSAGEPFPEIETFEQLLELCEKVQALPLVDGRKIVPIAADSGSVEKLYREFSTVFQASLSGPVDLDHNGANTVEESYLAILDGRVDLGDARIRGMFEALREVSRHFPPGFLGLDREQAMRRFRNGGAAMFISESYNAAVLFEAQERAAKRGERFEVGVMRLPQFDPKGRWAGRVGLFKSEASTTGNCDFVTYKNSRAITAEKNWPVDFLMYLTSQRVNERFCEQAFWLPVIRGTEPLERLAPFMPDLNGSAESSVLPMWASGGQFYYYLVGQMKAYVRGEIELDPLLEGLKEQAFSDGQFGLRYRLRDGYDRMKRRDRSVDRTLAAMSVPAAMAGEPLGRKYHRTLADQALRNGSEGDRYWYETRLGEPMSP